MRSFHAGIVLTGLLLAACGPGTEADPGTGEAVGSDTRMLSWRVTPLWAIGGADDPGVELSWLLDRHIATDRLGRVLVLDAHNHRILVVTQDGEVADSWGRRGSGPGELASPVSIDVAPTGDVEVFDVGLGAVTRFDPAGNPLGRVRLRHFPRGGVRSGPGAYLYVVTFMTPEGERERLMKEGEAAVSRLAEFIPPASRPGQYPSCPGYRVEAPPVGAQWLTWDVSGERAATITDPGYRVVLFHGDTAVATLQRDIPPIPLDAGGAALELARLPGFRDGLSIPPLGCTIPLDEVVRARGHAEHLPVLADVTLAPDGEIWVLRNTSPGSDRLIDVFAPDGTFAGTLPPGTPFPTRFVTPDMFVALGADSLDVPIVTAYVVARR